MKEGWEQRSSDREAIKGIWMYARVDVRSILPWGWKNAEGGPFFPKSKPRAIGELACPCFSSSEVAVVPGNPHARKRYSGKGWQGKPLGARYSGLQCAVGTGSWHGGSCVTLGLCWASLSDQEGKPSLRCYIEYQVSPLSFITISEYQLAKEKCLKCEGSFYRTGNSWWVDSFAFLTRLPYAVWLCFLH